MNELISGSRMLLLRYPFDNLDLSSKLYDRKQNCYTIKFFVSRFIFMSTRSQSLLEAFTTSSEFGGSNPRLSASHTVTDIVDGRVSRESTRILGDGDAALVVQTTKEKATRQKLKVISYNIWAMPKIAGWLSSWNGPKAEERAEAIANFLNKEDPDVVVFQEAFRNDIFDTIKSKVGSICNNTYCLNNRRHWEDSFDVSQIYADDFSIFFLF